ncbi:unnamed protein product [Paramecium sonneborni]|uniref:Uncharacterized protein n=1 Tax=Paramecium sonneborni TaxID=65129 RepID=A0A8S1KJ86_9CILI|nr:unnamed protein product [Paramecium sonneborni]
MFLGFFTNYRLKLINDNCQYYSLYIDIFKNPNNNKQCLDNSQTVLQFDCKEIEGYLKLQINASQLKMQHDNLQQEYCTRQVLIDNFEICLSQDIFHQQYKFNGVLSLTKLTISPNKSNLFNQQEKFELDQNNILIFIFYSNHFYQKKLMDISQYCDNFIINIQNLEQIQELLKIFNKNQQFSYKQTVRKIFFYQNICVAIQLSFLVINTSGIKNYFQQKLVQFINNNYFYFNESQSWLNKFIKFDSIVTEFCIKKQ